MAGEAIQPSLPEPGAIIDGKYEIVALVGKGGMGVVFEAIHTRLRQRVALKMLYPHIRDQPGSIARFEREARAAGQLTSRNIARVLDVETNRAELPYIVMEFLEGSDLDEELAERGRLPVTEAVDYVLQACAAMTEAHALGVIHRDLKPANLFLCRTQDGPIVKIVDFGISKITTEADGRLTAAMTTMGSPVYMSPEQLRGSAEVDARADIWSLAVILYELIAGRPPHVGTVTAVTAAIIADEPPKLGNLRKDVPPGLEEVVAKALEKDSARRYQDAVSFALALAPFGSPEAARLAAQAASSAPKLPASPSRKRLAMQLGDPRAPTVVSSVPKTSKTSADGWITAGSARTLRPQARTRAMAVGAGFVLVASVAGALLTRPHPAPAPASAVGVSISAESALPSPAVFPVASGAPSATATLDASSATEAPKPSASARAPAPKSRALPTISPAPAGAPAPAPTTNPLHL